jgi:hypothetical protein
MEQMEAPITLYGYTVPMKYPVLAGLLICFGFGLQGALIFGLACYIGTTSIGNQIGSNFGAARQRNVPAPSQNSQRQAPTSSSTQSNPNAQGQGSSNPLSAFISSFITPPAPPQQNNEVILIN